MLCEHEWKKKSKNINVKMKSLCIKPKCILILYPAKWLNFLKAFLASQKKAALQASIECGFCCFFLNATISVDIFHCNDKVFQEIGRNKFKIENMQTMRGREG